MAKFTIIFCVLLSAFGTQAGLMTIGSSILQSNIQATINKMSEIKQEFESNAGFTLEEFMEKMVKTSTEWEDKMIEAMSENSGSSTCSQYLTQLQDVKNKMINETMTEWEGMFSIMQSDALLAAELADIMMAAAESAETKITECLSNMFTMVSCMQKVRTTFAETMASNLPTFITIGVKFTTYQATMTTQMAASQLSQTSNFNTIGAELYEALQECTFANAESTA